MRVLVRVVVRRRRLPLGPVRRLAGAGPGWIRRGLGVRLGAPLAVLACTCVATVMGSGRRAMAAGMHMARVLMVAGFDIDAQEHDERQAKASEGKRRQARSCTGTR